MSKHRVGRADIHAVLIRLANGDRQAVTPLVVVLWPVLCAFARRAVGNADDAEDIAQETLIKIAARVSDFDSGRDGLSWAFAIASFEVKSHRNRVTRRREVDDPAALEQVADVRSSPELVQTAGRGDILSTCATVRRNPSCQLSLGNLVSRQPEPHDYGSFVASE